MRSTGVCWLRCHCDMHNGRLAPGQSVDNSKAPARERHVAYELPDPLALGLPRRRWRRPATLLAPPAYALKRHRGWIATGDGWLPYIRGCEQGVADTGPIVRTGRFSQVDDLLFQPCDFGVMALRPRPPFFTAWRAPQTVHPSCSAISAQVCPACLSARTLPRGGRGTRGRPIALPALRAFSRPSLVRSTMRSRSSSAAAVLGPQHSA